MGSNVWEQEIAEVYDATSAAMFAPEVLGPTVDVLAELAGDEPALELAIGTGRVGLALAARGVDVHGIELSPHMVDQLRSKPAADSVSVTVGDMTSTRIDITCSLVYLVFNTIMNVTTLDEQVAVFENAAAHLRPGGCFVVELVVPQLRRLPPGELARVFTLEDGHVGVETFDDVVGQISWSHHWIDAGGRMVRHSAPYRYIWPAELELMGKVAGFRLRDRWADWHRAPFTNDSPSQVAVFEKIR
jgi:SAM-dependent methyltransferase